MNATNDVETADRLSRRRARMLPVLAVIFLSQQASFFADYSADPGRLVDHVKVGAWVVLSLVLLLALGTGGFWFKPKRVRELIDDEDTRANRQRAWGMGFWAAMGCSLVFYFVSQFERVDAREAIHLIVTAAIATALITFGVLEKCAHRDG